MAQVAFDTLKFVETLEGAGLPKEQAKAISLAVRDSHEAVDVATRRDLDDAKKELSSEVTVVKRDLEDVRKELKSDIALVRTEITDVRKDLEAKIDKLSLQLTVRLGGMLVAAIGVLAALIKCTSSDLI
ncbi:CCDC90 family protein [Erwinia tracheiphila]|uniref:CCDC90 family protein n=1 Tax=Erwinia tracheiphila TaxID=65700 RepID=UPI001F29843F|nr:CCDC90 family protein [Erwinia tracheiphila]UIA94760.1 CCDC90 family protein [Erwinia tracheiphila]